jgi:hypothetical protein
MRKPRKLQENITLLKIAATFEDLKNPISTSIPIIPIVFII